MNNIEIRPAFINRTAKPYTMIRSLNYVAVFGLLAITASCFKELSPETENVVVPVNILPKKITYESLKDGYFEVRSIKYDTLNNNIEVYNDDTTTTNLFDSLLYSYQYNNDGYLTKFSSFKNPAHPRVSVIERDASNRIKYITNHDLFASTDTSFYTYDIKGNDLQIKATRHSRFYGVGVDEYTYSNNVLQLIKKTVAGISNENRYQYAQNKILSYSEYEGAKQYVNKIAYNSESVEGKQDHFMELILGKDHYIQDLREMYFFFLYKYQYFMISASDPNQPASFVTEELTAGKSTEIFSVNYSYQLNDQQLPVLISLESKANKSSIQIQY